MHRATLLSVSIATLGLVLGSLAGPVAARAVIARSYSGTACAGFERNYGYTVIEERDAYGNNESLWGLDVNCPIVDDSYLSRTAITNVDVVVYDSDTASKVQSQCCSNTNGAWGQNCSMPADDGANSVTGWHTVSPSPSVWTTYSGWPWVYVHSTNDAFFAVNGYNTHT